MHDAITSRLEDAARAVAADRPDLPWVIERGRRLRTRRIAGTALVAVASLAVVVMTMNVLVGARDRDTIEVGPRPAGDATSPRDQATNYGQLVLPDDELTAAIPDGFELEGIIRNDEEFESKGWVTVGVRLVPEDLTYARAIFYVLPDERSALELYEEQAGNTRTQFTHIDGPKPEPVPGVDQSLCGGGLPGLWTCHATSGRIYLVTQSGDYPSARELDPEDRIYGERLLRAFAAVMDE